MIRRLGGLVFACLLAAGCGGVGGIQHTDIPPLRGHKALFDQALVDQSTRRLYVADEGILAVDVFNTSQDPPRFLASVPVGHPPHGLAAAPDLREVFVGLDGGGIAVLQADPSAPAVNRVLAVIQTSARKNIDLVDYDPSSQVLWAAASDEGILFKVDATRNQVLGSLQLPGTLEQPRFDPGLKAVFVGDSATNELFQVDPAQLQLAQRWKLGVACTPAGLGIDSRREVALIGCLDPAAGYTLAWDLKAGRLIRTLSDVGDADQVVYDAKADVFMVAGQSSATTAIGFFGGSPVAFQNVRITHADSRGVALDEAGQTVYTPDSKPGNEGLLSFPLPRPQPASPPFVGPLIYLVPLLLVGIAVWYYGRRRAQERRLSGRPMYS
jgi:hypothetical protein